MFHRARFNFMAEARIWYSWDPEAKLLPGDCQNAIILSDEFYREVLSPPECPASVDADGTGLFVDKANGILPQGGSDARN